MKKPGGLPPISSKAELRGLFSANLRTACSTRPSISEICRAIGINRQQFNRYTSGQALPSPFNQRRIAEAFGLEAEDFQLPVTAFRKKLVPRDWQPEPRNRLFSAFSGNTAALERYLGFYQTYHLSLSWRGRVVCACTHLRVRDGHVVVSTHERFADPASRISARSRYSGLAAWQRDRIFISECTTGENTTFGQTILMPFEIHQRLYLRGVTMGVSWRAQNMPYAARTIWRFYGKEADRRALLGRCGIYRLDDGSLSEPVTRYLASAASALVTIQAAGDDDGWQPPA